MGKRGRVAGTKFPNGYKKNIPKEIEGEKPIAEVLEEKKEAPITA